MKRRIARLNSLMREVLSEVIRKDVKNPDIGQLITVTGVEISEDISHAKVHISVIGTSEEKRKTIDALRSASGYIAVLASKKMVLRYFPELHFRLDESVEKAFRIESLLNSVLPKEGNETKAVDSE